jgi:membrane associated rhomboid family serine protease
MKCPTCGDDIYAKSYWRHEIDGVKRIDRYLILLVLFVVQMILTGVKDPEIDLATALGGALGVFIFAYYFSLIAKKENRLKALGWLCLLFFILQSIGRYGIPGMLR